MPEDADPPFARYVEQNPLSLKEYALTDEQVDNWRQLLVTMPLPPFRLALGVYALIMPRQRVVDVVYRLKELIEAERFNKKFTKEREMILDEQTSSLHKLPMNHTAIMHHFETNRNFLQPDNLILDTHITRTRPRNPNKPQRTFR